MRDIQTKKVSVQRKLKTKNIKSKKYHIRAFTKNCLQSHNKNYNFINKLKNMKTNGSKIIFFVGVGFSVVVAMISLMFALG